MPKGFLPSTILSFASISTVVLLISYGAITHYYAGYLRRFGVDINYIAFWPSPYDFSVYGVAILLGIVVSLSVFLLLQWAERGIARHILRHGKSKFIRSYAEVLTGRARKIITGLACCALVIFGVYLISYKVGSDMAINQKEFTVLNDYESKNKMVVIYQNGEMMIVKKFDVISKRFTDDYRVLDLAGHSFRIEELR